MLARREETEEQEWFKHWRKMNAKMEWQFDPMSVTHTPDHFFLALPVTKFYFQDGGIV